MTEPLLQLGDWLEAEGVAHVAMESTGVYWKPIWNLLEGRFAILLVAVGQSANVWKGSISTSGLTGANDLVLGRGERCQTRC
jgi:hypothetical protein